MRVIVQSAVIVEPMTTRGVPIYQTSLTEGGAPRGRGRCRRRSSRSIPTKSALLTEAMAVDAKLTTIPRSGRPDDPLNSRTPDLRPSARSPARETQVHSRPGVATGRMPALQRRRNHHGTEAGADRGPEALTCWSRLR